MNEKKLTSEIGEHLEGLEKIGQESNSLIGPQILTNVEQIIALGLPEDVQNQFIERIKAGAYCAAWNYADVGLSCGASGKLSHCVWCPGWGWTYFKNYQCACAGSTLQVCYESRGSCG